MVIAVNVRMSFPSSSNGTDVPANSGPSARYPWPMARHSVGDPVDSVRPGLGRCRHTGEERSP